MNIKQKKFDEHQCQHCGSETKLVETVVCDTFCWSGEEYDNVGFTDDFHHTGKETCAECGKEWTGA